MTSSTARSRRLSDSDLSTISNGLYVAASEFDKHVAECRAMAQRLRDGETFPLWAAGELGAIAAERTAEQFEKQAADSRRLVEELTETAYEVTVTFDEDGS